MPGTPRKRRARLGLGVASAALALGISAPAAALQPLSAFLEHAAASNPDNREASATAEQRDAEARSALGRLLPAFSARGVYTRNQVEVDFNLPGGPPGGLVVTPLNQVDGFFQLELPIFDPGAFGRYRAARAVADAQKDSGAVTKLDVEKQIVRSYYQVLGASALVASADKSLEVAKQNAEFVLNRRTGGIASDLDVQRAKANVERAEQDRADAELTIGLATRSLETLTGVAPTAVSALPPDDLHEEESFAAWLAPGAILPRVRAATAQSNAASKGREAAKLALLPTLSATAAEHVTNATAFTAGHTALFTATATLAWRLDFSLAANIRAQDAALAAAQARQQKVTRAAEDDVYEAWLRVATGIAKSRSARAQAESTEQAAALAADRYAGGLATQLDVITAQRDAFGAGVARVAADADLAAARVVLRISAGRRLDDKQRSSP